jgi:hypothetical protein
MFDAGARAPQDARMRIASLIASSTVIVADGNQYFNRPGPRLVESLEILAEVLHPGTLPPRHRGSGWVVGTARR